MFHMRPYSIPKSAKNAINDPLPLGKMNLLTWAAALSHWSPAASRLPGPLWMCMFNFIWSLAPEICPFPTVEKGLYPAALDLPWICFTLQPGPFWNPSVESHSSARFLQLFCLHYDSVF